MSKDSFKSPGLSGFVLKTKRSLFKHELNSNLISLVDEPFLKEYDKYVFMKINSYELQRQNEKEFDQCSYTYAATEGVAVRA